MFQGITASAIELDIDVGKNETENTCLLLLDCKAQDCTHVRGLVDFLKNNVQAISEAPKLQSRLWPNAGNYPGSRRVLLAVIVRTITGFEQTAVFKENVSKGKMELKLPAISGAGATGSMKHKEGETASQRGIIGVAVAILQLEVTAASNAVRVLTSVPILQHVDDSEFKKAVSWKKMSRYLKRFKRQVQAGFSFVLGRTLEYDDDMSSVGSYHTAREDAAESAKKFEACKMDSCRCRASKSGV